MIEGRYSCTGIEVIRTELSLPARNEEATDAIRGQSNGQIEVLFDIVPNVIRLRHVLLLLLLVKSSK